MFVAAWVGNLEGALCSTPRWEQTLQRQKCCLQCYRTVWFDTWDACLRLQPSCGYALGVKLGPRQKAHSRHCGAHVCVCGCGTGDMQE